MASINVRDLGDFIRDQRVTAKISLRQLARSAGVSNPYLSQIERGLRRPSAEILQQIAKALRISAEALYVQAGILDERVGGEDVRAALFADAGLTERQKHVLAEIYDSFRKENAADEALVPVPAETEPPSVVPAPDVVPPAVSTESASPTRAPRKRTSTTG